MFSHRRKLGFAEAARFNYELDTNEDLKNGLKELSLRSRQISRETYLSQLLELFHRAGLSLTLQELDMLLLLRQKTDQLLLTEKQRRDS